MTPKQKPSQKKSNLELRQLIQHRGNIEKGKGSQKSGKQTVNSGQEFSYDIKQKKEKTIKENEISLCRLKCSESISQQQRQEVSNDFYKSSDRVGQTQELASLVTRRPEDRTRKSGNAVKTRNREYTREYTLLSNGIPTKVCTTMFPNTIGISEKIIRIALANVTYNGAPILETRGRHGNQRTSQVREEIVMKHIKLYKVVESNYVWKESKYEYLPAGF